MDRRTLLQTGAALGLLGPAHALAALAAPDAPKVISAVSAKKLPPLVGSLTVYLGRGEGGLYGDILDAIRKQNPELDLEVRRGSAAALANTIVAEARAGVSRADLFWSIDASSLGAVASQGLGYPVPDDIRRRIKPTFRNPQWAAISGRLRTVPYNPTRVGVDRIPADIMAFAETDYRIGWAPAYGAFQSFITAMRLLEGDERTKEWLRAIKPRATTYAGEFSVVLGVASGEVDLGFANHYYTLRLKSGQPEASVRLALTEDDAGSLVNASGVVLLNDNPLAADFVRWLLSMQVQSFLAREAYEIPLAPGVPLPDGLPDAIDPPEIELTRLSNLQPTLDLLRETGVL